MVANPIGGKLMQMGRWKMMVVGALVTIIGNILMCIAKFPVYLAGTIILSTGDGLTNPVQFRYIEEYVPEKYVPTCFAAVTVIGSVSHLFSELSAVILP